MEIITGGKMMKRYTKKELEEMSDMQFIASILRDRKSTLANPYSPLAEKIDSVVYKVIEADGLNKTFEDFYK